MRKMLILFLVCLIAASLVSCANDSDDDASDADSASQEETPEETPEVTEAPELPPEVEEGTELPKEDPEEFVAIEGGDTFLISDSCVDTSGTYTGQLRDGGVFILRNGGTPDSGLVDFQPSSNADPLSSQKPEDTSVSSDGSFVTGTTTVTTEDGANSLKLDFGILIDDTEQSC